MHNQNFGCAFLFQTKKQFFEFPKLFGAMSQSRMIHDRAFINGEWVSAKSGKTFEGTCYTINKQRLNAEN